MGTMAFRNIAITKEDFDNTGWEEMVEQSSAKQCYAYASQFAAKVKEAIEAGEEKGEEVFTTLLAATDSRLELGVDDNPFQPTWQFDSRRSFVPDDIPEAHLDVLQEITPTVTDVELRARLADILWTRRRDHQMAIMAVEAYLEAAQALEHPVSWLEGRDRAWRALEIAAPLGKNAPHIQSVVAYIENVIDRFVGKEPELLPARMMDILLIYRKGDPNKYAPIAHTAAEQAQARHDWEIARDYWTIEAKWHALNKNSEAEREAKIRAAETYVRLADDFIHGSSPSYLSATIQIEQGIEAYRRVGKCSERMKELRVVLDNYQRRSVSELQTRTIELPGVEEVAKQAIEHVKGLPLPDALIRLASLFRSPDLESLRTLAKETGIDAPISLLASSVRIDKEGRTVARERAGSPEDATSDPAVIRVAQMQQMYLANAAIEPARYQITLQHHMTLSG